MDSLTRQVLELKTVLALNQAKANGGIEYTEPVGPSADMDADVMSLEDYQEKSSLVKEQARARARRVAINVGLPVDVLERMERAYAK